jgi:hypothetical protein
MVSLYEHEQMFDEAESLMYAMKARALDTRPGWSWIQIKQSIHVFEVEGKPHPDTAEIYEELIRLIFRSERQDMCQTRSKTREGEAAAEPY